MNSISIFQESVERVENNDWSNRCPSQEFKKTLAISPATHLNIYICPYGDPGTATMPWWYSEDDVQQGVIIHTETLPGGSMISINQGDNAIREV